MFRFLWCSIVGGYKLLEEYSASIFRVKVAYGCSYIKQSHIKEGGYRDTREREEPEPSSGQ
jgi:hypothetical protein